MLVRRRLERRLFQCRAAPDEGLAQPCKAIIGPWVHKYPHFAVPEPRIGFLQEALRWWDFWLKGEPTGVSAIRPSASM